MDSPGSSGQSQGEKKARKPKKLRSEIIRKEINLVDGIPIGYLELNKPCGLADVVESSDCRLDVCLELIDPTDMFSLFILREINHKNILHMETVVEKSVPDSSSIMIGVEKYTELLASFLIVDRMIVSHLNNLVPTVLLRNIVSQILEGLDELWVNHYYHGNLELENTYYNKESGLVKLANFKKKDGLELKEAQFEDLHAVGRMLEILSNKVKNVKTEYNCALIDDLAYRLQYAPHINIFKVKEEILDHPFFWNKYRRTRFFVVDIPKFLNCPEFTKKIGKLQISPSPWVQNDHYGLVYAMNAYRVNVLKIKKYGDSSVEFIRFVSGCYTHESQLDWMCDDTVDIIMQRIHPTLCLELTRILHMN